MVARTAEGFARPVVRGAALFNGDKMENVLPQDNVPALLMLCNDFNNGSLTAVLDDGTRVGILLTKSKTKVKTSVENGCPSFDIFCRLCCRLYRDVKKL